MEFDTFGELRKFDGSYVDDTRSAILKDICRRMSWNEADLDNIEKLAFEENRAVFTIGHKGTPYRVVWESGNIIIDRQ